VTLETRTGYNYNIEAIWKLWIQQRHFHFFLERIRLMPTIWSQFANHFIIVVHFLIVYVSYVFYHLNYHLYQCMLHCL